VAGLCEDGNENSLSIKAGIFLTSCETSNFSTRPLHQGVKYGLRF